MIGVNSMIYRYLIQKILYKGNQSLRINKFFFIQPKT